MMQGKELRLAPYAMREDRSPGRQYAEPEHPYRGLYQRDRDRILHASAFRRLTAKTQVLVSGTNDHHRTRLTHTLEVMQVCRTIARQMRLNEDLTEAIALAHDLGHPPFGHAGEAALDLCMQEHGGFEHNRQGLRVVEELEERYPRFPGLNLSWEVRESLAFHSKRPESAEVMRYRKNILQPTLEAQVVDAADSIVYDVHDLDDAFGFQLIDLEQLRQLKVWRELEAELLSREGALSPERLLASVLRQILSDREGDLLQYSQRLIEKLNLQTCDEVKMLAYPVIQEDPAQAWRSGEIKTFLHQCVYGHPRVKEMTHQGKQIVTDLFHEYSRHPEWLPDSYRERIHKTGDSQGVCDYIAGMTDRFAEQQFKRLFPSIKK